MRNIRFLLGHLPGLTRLADCVMPIDVGLHEGRLLEEAWPAASEITAARIKEREAAQPVPETLHALRNVAGTLIVAGPSGWARARDHLQSAVRIKEVWLESPEHPGAPALFPFRYFRNEVSGACPVYLLTFYYKVRRNLCYLSCLASFGVVLPACADQAATTWYIPQRQCVWRRSNESAPPLICCFSDTWDNILGRRSSLKLDWDVLAAYDILDHGGGSHAVASRSRTC